jgi:hypothetical protein
MMEETAGRDATTLGSLTGCGILMAVLAVAATIALWRGSEPPERARAVAFAAAVAGSGSILGWLATRRATRSPAAAVGGTLAGTLLRLGPPLAGLAGLGAAGGDLLRGGADRLLVVFYLVLLATTIFLDIIGGSGRRRKPPPNTTSDGRTPTGI